MTPRTIAVLALSCATLGCAELLLTPAAASAEPSEIRFLDAKSGCRLVHPGTRTLVDGVIQVRRRAYLEGARGLTRAQVPVWQLLSQQESPTLVIEDVAMDPAIPPEVARRLGSGALVGMRLEHRSVQRGGVPELLGTLFLSFRAPRVFSRQERTAMESLAGMASVALANARLHADSLESAARAQDERGSLLALSDVCRDFLE